MVDIVSKNGALLLNIGPKPDGTIPEQEEKILLEIGDWLLVNGEGIYGTRPWKVYGEGPTKVVAGSFADTKRSEFTGRDIRFTTKGNSLYAIVLGRPEKDEVIIQSLSTSLRLFNKDIADSDYRFTCTPPQGYTYKGCSAGWSIPTKGAPRNGYYMAVVRKYNSIPISTPVSSSEYGMPAAPENYNHIGNHVFVVDKKGEKYKSESATKSASEIFWN